MSEGISHTSNRSTAEAVSEGSSHTDNRSAGTTAGRTAGSGTSRTSAQSRGSAQTRGQSQGYSTSDGRTSGRNYGPHIFFEPFEHGTSRGDTYGRSWSQGQNDQRSTSQGSTRTEEFNESQGTSYAQSETRGASDTRTVGRTRTEGMGESDSRTEGRTRTQGTGESDSRTQGKTRTQTSGESEGATLTESFHVKPLLSALEAKQLLRSLPEAEREHPAYPGFALITLADEEHPFFVRKANHDQDPFFVRKFTPNPAFRFIPYDQQPLLGWQITPDHFYLVQIPDILRGPDLAIDARFVGPLSANDRLNPGDEFLEVFPESNSEWLIQAPNYRVSTSLPIKVMEVIPPPISRETGKLVVFRADSAITEQERQELDQRLWGHGIAARDAELARRHEEEMARQAEMERRATEEEARRREEDRVRQVEAERRASEKAAQIAEAERKIEDKEREITKTQSTMQRLGCDTWTTSVFIVLMMIWLAGWVASTVHEGFSAFFFYPFVGLIPALPTYIVTVNRMNRFDNYGHNDERTPLRPAMVLVANVATIIIGIMVIDSLDHGGRLEDIDISSILSQLVQVIGPLVVVLYLIRVGLLVFARHAPVSWELPNEKYIRLLREQKETLKKELAEVRA